MQVCVSVLSEQSLLSSVDESCAAESGVFTRQLSAGGTLTWTEDSGVAPTAHAPEPAQLPRAVSMLVAAEERRGNPNCPFCDGTGMYACAACMCASMSV